MKVALFGGTGFVGSYITDKLIESGHVPRILVREGSHQKVNSPDKCEIVEGNISDTNSIQDVIKGTDAVIYTIGIIREFKGEGVTYESLHFECVLNCIEKAKECGVKRFILMSANGVSPDGTGYQKSKWISEQYLKNTNLDWTIFRPSTIFGDPRGKNRPEFCSQLKKDLINLPFPAPLFHEGLIPFNAGNFSMSPIHINDVANCFIKSIDDKKDYKKTIELGGVDVTWREIIKTISSAIGKKKLMVPAPVVVVKAVASVLDRFSWFPVTKDQLTMLVEGNTCESTKYFSDNDIKPLPFNIDNLSYLKDS
jgi:NADH dehydrogenase